MKKIYLTALWSILLLLAAGCSGSPKVSFYTLAPVAQESDSSPLDSHILIGPSNLPREVQRSQVISRPAPTEIKINESKRWAGALELVFDRTIADNLEKLLPTDRVVAYPAETRQPASYRIPIDVRQFDGEPGETVNLRGAFSVVDSEGSVIADGVFDISQPTDDSSFDAFIEAHSAAVGALSEQIAAAIPR